MKKTISKGLTLYDSISITFVELQNFLNLKFFKYLFLRERDRQSTSWGGAEREGDTESEAGSRL